MHFKQSAELLHAVLTEPAAADKQMDRYFRAHRAMGARDRAAVVETVYACLRHKRLLEHLAESSDPLALVAAHWLRAGLSARALEDAGFVDASRELAQRACTAAIERLPLAIRFSFPDWLAERLAAQYGQAEAPALAEALNHPAPVDLRVNTLKAKRDDVQQRLHQAGFLCGPTPYSPVGLRLGARAQVSRTPLFQEGLFEAQDEGSQILSFLLEPRRGETIADFCAGAGGKTLHLGALLGNTGSVYAFDTSAARLERLTPRVRRAGLSNVRTVALAHERDTRVQRLYGKIDRVLVDAPCSGTGTLRRSPEIKWRALDLAATSDRQRRILEAAALLVKPGGRLVYATCSVLAEENEAIVAEFLARHSAFALLPAGPVLARRHLPLEPGGDGSVRLLPHRHGTDGFYAAILERAATG